MPPFASYTMSGSSPRMRGTRHNRRQGLHQPGIIPAYAGNTRLRRVARVWRRDHPRVCGEHQTAWSAGCRGWGSSPRMRGTQGLVVEPFGEPGIIPAYAGNTVRPHPSHAWPWDHPRVCGEHVTIPEDALLTAGSSPRMRGTLISAFDPRFDHGIIPAYAGNTKEA